MTLRQAEVLATKMRDIEHNIRKQERAVPGTVALFNNVGDILVAGDVVVLDTTTSRSVVLATANGAQAPLVVVVEGDYEEKVKCTKRGYGVIEITCEGPAISPGDCIVTSAVPRQARVDNTATVRNLIGFALESKSAGVTADIKVLI